MWKICPSKFIPSSDRETLRWTSWVSLRLDGPRLKVEVHDSTSRKRLNKYVCLERLQEKPLHSEEWQHGQTEQSKDARRRQARGDEPGGDEPGGDEARADEPGGDEPGARCPSTMHSSMCGDKHSEQLSAPC